MAARFYGFPPFERRFRIAAGMTGEGAAVLRIA